MVGAGPGGLVAALTAAREGLDVTLFEARPGLATAGTWLLGLPVQERLAALGLKLPHVSPGRALVQDEQGRRLLELHHPGVVVTRTWLLETLLRAAREAGAKVFLDTHLSAPPAADLIIGADGCRSSVRAWAGLPATVSSLGHYYRGTVPGQRTELPRELWNGDGRRFGFDPLPGATGFYCTAPEHDCEGFVESWRSPEVRQALAACDWSAVERCRPLDVWAPRWAAPPFVLIGDAAHGQPPTLGQGANLAMLDGFTLARLAAQTSDLDELARQYERARVPITRRVHLAARLVGRLSADRLGSFALRWADRLGFLKPWAVRLVSGGL